MPSRAQHPTYLLIAYNLPGGMVVGMGAIMVVVTIVLVGDITEVVVVAG